MHSKHPLAQLLAITVIAMFAAGCGNSGSSESDVAVADAACPAAGSIDTASEIFSDRVPDADTLMDWQEQMVAFGLRLPGSEPLRQWHQFLINHLDSYGLLVRTEPVAVTQSRDYTSWSLSITSGGNTTSVPAPSYYPYSGITDADGVSGELVDVGTGSADEIAAADAASSLAGKVVLIHEPRVPLTEGFFLQNATAVYDPDDTIAPSNPYERAWTSILAAQNASPAQARARGAIGAIIVLDYSFDNVQGQYTPFSAGPQDIPTLYVDDATGQMLTQQAESSPQVNLVLTADSNFSGSTEDIIATLPGQSNDELILINSHTDGTSSAEENGGIAMLAMAKYFASLPDECRQRTMVFFLTPGHFSSDLEDTQRFVTNHPDMIDKAVASMTIEHLGQMEWVDDEDGYHPTGRTEEGILYGSPTRIQSLALAGITRQDLRRTTIAKPDADGSYFGIGSPLNTAGVPNLSYISGPNALLSFGAPTDAGGFTQNLDKVDKDLLYQQTLAFTRLVATMDATDAESLAEPLDE